MQTKYAIQQNVISMDCTTYSNSLNINGIGQNIRFSTGHLYYRFLNRTKQKQNKIPTDSGSIQLTQLLHCNNIKNIHFHKCDTSVSTKNDKTKPFTLSNLTVHLNNNSIKLQGTINKALFYKVRTTQFTSLQNLN